jgi:histidine phosphotransfer protein HptB
MCNGVDEKKSVESIRLHLIQQFNLPGEQIDMLLPSFITTLGAHMSNLENALAEKNPVLLGKVGHTIKGAFLNLGLQDCAQIALTIEEKGRNGGKIADFRKLIENLRLLIKPVLE